MKIYIYAKGDHTFGLDAIRRCSYIAKLLNEKSCEAILCVNEFSAGAYAKKQLNIKNYIITETLDELSKVLKKGDSLIYESDEISQFIETQEKNYFSFLYKIPDDIPISIIDSFLYKKQNSRKDEKLFFYGDEDYSKYLINLCEKTTKYDIPILLGEYFFIGDEKKLENRFSQLINSQEYLKCVQNTKYLLSGSLNTCLESIECGNKPVLLKRVDKNYDEKLIKNIHLPTIDFTNLDEILVKFEDIISNYPKLNKKEKFNLDTIINDIFIRINTYRRLNL